MLQKINAPLFLILPPSLILPFFLKTTFLLGEIATPHLIPFFKGKPSLLKGEVLTVLEVYKLLGCEMNIMVSYNVSKKI